MNMTVTVNCLHLSGSFPKNPGGVFFLKRDMDQTVSDVINQTGLPPDTPNLFL
jgi:hypothetical protein